MTPEERARERIDAMLRACGWLVQDRAERDIYAGPGVAIREFPLLGGVDALFGARLQPLLDELNEWLIA